MATYDIFVSYRRKDAEVVSAFAGALRQEGLQVWIDERRIDDFESIQTAIEDGLTHSKCFFAWYSKSYPESRPCQWEFTAAFTTAQSVDPAMERILVINSEGSSDHIQPEFFRDQQYLIPSGENRAGLAETIRRKLEVLTGTFGDFIQDGKLMAKPPRYRRYATSADYFTGRLGENEQEAKLSERIAHYEYNRGVYSQATQLHKRVLDVRRRLLGEEHPDSYK
jgi:hypothetical protein